MEKTKDKTNKQNQVEFGLVNFARTDTKFEILLKYNKICGQLCPINVLDFEPEKNFKPTPIPHWRQSS